MWSPSLVIILAIACGAYVHGNEDDSNRIVGGRNATIEEFPWQVSIINITNGRHFCGGFILDRFTIGTAAHCFQHTYPVRVRAGSTFRSTDGYVRDVRRVIVHPYYSTVTQDSDIALLKLRYPLFYNSRVQPVALPEFNYDVAVNTALLISGWGREEFSNDALLPEQLKAVEVQAIDQDVCNKAYIKFPVRITDNMFCAGIESVGGKDSCQGDSGGPVVDVYNGRAVVQGIVSWGRGCALKDYPGVNTRISRFLQWIEAAK